MCGIAAIISLEREIPPEAIGNMIASIKHRGPDAQASVTFPNCHLGHTRLSIIDLAGGNQPMTEETERYWIVFNGEIYNYRQLRQELEQQGWHFRTQSDTEVILRAYQQYGADVPTYLNGQFAFAIWDRSERKLFAARDRLGEKPFYYAHSPQGYLLIASEIKAILASHLIQPRIDLVSVDAYLALLYVPPDRTIYENVHTLKPAHALVWQNGQIRQWRYWQPTYSQKLLLPSEAVEQIRHLITEAVKRQMVADVPVGAFLSGGLDSSTIVALMTEHTNQPVKTFSVGFGDLIDELPYALTMAQVYQTDHAELQMDIAVGEVLEKLASVYDEPFADSSNIPTYLISEFARRHVKVVLSGDGGDELFGGYEWYSWLLAEENTSPDYRLSLWLKMMVWRILAKLSLPFHYRRDAAILRYHQTQLKYRHSDWCERHLAFATSLKGNRTNLWHQDFARKTAKTVAHAYQPPTDLEAMDRVTYFDLQCYLPGDILVKVDRSAMAHGLETRSPFLDVELVEFVLSLPWRLRFQDENRKFLLRQACSHLWTDSVRKRSKQGFGGPVGNWIERQDIQRLMQRLCLSESPLSNLLPGAKIALPSLVPQKQWTILCLGLWLEQQSECLNHLP